ncbi:hypothetical protein [Actinoplanes siamensis]|uniref:Uncharacterized protein n=1 Tax=Actinoplanes siamensis TaxID=1223317 RepID=A0A919N668_9ACTN|nr:hypothetical protein [Actinoplanes siamensis]GIF05188.1 hypothetical protein Asi03nite_27260 [Actinoplanes siamensis]
MFGAPRGRSRSGPLGTANRFPLTPNPDYDKDEIRPLLCAPTTTMPVRYCVTHITPKPFGTFGKIQVPPHRDAAGRATGVRSAGVLVVVLRPRARWWRRSPPTAALVADGGAPGRRHAPR